jgi:ribonuclease HI
MKKLFVYFDGKARGEPGEAGIGIAITDKDGKVLEEASRLVGRLTSEAVEYHALIEAANLALAYEPESVIFFTESQRLANYINGVFETRAPHTKHLIELAIGSLNRLPSWRVNYVDRHANYRAPRLVERAFHQNAKEQINRDRLELVLQARAASLSEDGLRKLVDYAERLQEER